MKKIVMTLLTVAIIGLSGCEKWLDVNQNPNDATKASPDLILAGVLTSWGADVNGLNTTMGGWMGYWAHAGGWSGFYSEKKYEITSNYYPGAFNDYYTGVLPDTKFIRDNSGNNIIYPAITNVVDAWYYSRLVDLYGDVPYTQACDPSILSPVYDDDEVIYADLISRLNNAIQVFDDAVNAPDHATNEMYSFKNSVDIIFGGDFARWGTFANTLKLRLVMRMTNVKNSSELKAIMDNTLNLGFINADVTLSPGYIVSSGKTNPLWNQFGKYYNLVNTSENPKYILNKYFHERLKALNDPRLNQFFFAPPAAAGIIKSIVFGTDGDLVVQPNATQGANYSWIRIAADASVSDGVNSGDGALDRQKIFLLTEALFLQAEARVRGIIMTGTTHALYEAAVRQSLNDCKIPEGTAQDDYLTQTNVAWDEGASIDIKIQKIIDQKWISNYFLNHFESYNDYRRTGYPKPKGAGIDPSWEMLSYYPSGVIRRQIPRLFPYPNQEFYLNKENVLDAVARQGVEFTTSKYPFDARVFWDKAPLNIVY
jgi:hypothetical protein